MRGPVTVAALAEATALAPARVRVGLGRLEAEGFAMQGDFDPALESADGENNEQWCPRRLLSRIHSYTQNRLRREIEPVTAQDLVRFLLRWQHVADGTERQGRARALGGDRSAPGVRNRGGAWRTTSWRPGSRTTSTAGSKTCAFRASSCGGGSRCGRPIPRVSPDSGATTPSRATPVTFAQRDDLAWLLQTARGRAASRRPGPWCRL